MMRQFLFIFINFFLLLNKIKPYKLIKINKYNLKKNLRLGHEDIDYTLHLRVPGQIMDMFDGLRSNPSSIDLDVSKLYGMIGSTSNTMNIFKMSSITSMEPLLPYFIAFTGIFALFWPKKSSNNDSLFSNVVPVYNPEHADEYFRKRPWLVLGRLLRILWLTSSFNFNLLLDWQFKNLKKNEQDRAREATHLLSNLGPTFVKLGQALSIRTDIIPETYALELRKLQDSVPPFDNEHAKSIICKELKIKNFSEKFRSFSERPVASASIGQVYKAVLHNGQEVAVKVQRPSITDEIGLDLYILRMLAPLQVRLTNLVNGSPTDSTDIAVGFSLVDEWGRGLVGEVDYLQEARNTNQFLEAMKKRGLDAVTSPRIFEELSTSKVLVSEWITGTRLDKDSSADVPRYGICILLYNMISCLTLFVINEQTLRYCTKCISHHAFRYWSFTLRVSLSYTS
jgi:hypothetical protein